MSYFKQKYPNAIGVYLIKVDGIPNVDKSLQGLSPTSEEYALRRFPDAKRFTFVVKFKTGGSQTITVSRNQI